MRENERETELVGGSNFSVTSGKTTRSLSDGTAEREHDWSREEGSEGDLGGIRWGRRQETRRVDLAFSFQHFTCIPSIQQQSGSEYSQLGTIQP